MPDIARRVLLKKSLLSREELRVESTGVDFVKVESSASEEDFNDLIRPALCDTR